MTSKRIINDIFWVMLGRVLIGLTLLLTVKVLTEIVAPIEYGYYALVISLTGFVFNVVYLPVNNAATRFIPRNSLKGTQYEKTLLAIVSKKHFNAILLVVVLYLSLSYFSDLPLKIETVLLAVVFTILTGSRSIYTFILEANRRQKFSSVWKFSETFLKLVFSVLFVTLISENFGFMILGSVVGLMIPIFFLSKLVVREDANAANQLSNNDKKEIASYMTPFILVGAMSWSIAFSDRFILSFFSNSAEVGIYYAAYSIVSFPIIQIGGVLSTAIQPIFFRGGDDGSNNRHFFAWLAACTLSIVPIVAVVYFFSDLIALSFLGKEYQNGSSYMIWIASGYGVLSLSMAIDAKLMLYKKTRALAKIMTITAVTNIILTVIMVIYFGAYGAAVSTFITFSMQFLITLFYYLTYVKH